MSLHCGRIIAVRKKSMKPGYSYIKKPEVPRIAFLLCLFFLFLFAGSAFPDTINYVYDNLGRLVETVSSNGAKIIYSYDKAGHVIFVTRTSESQQPPMLTEITPQNVFIGGEASITIAGSNLLTTNSVKTDNPGIKIVNYSASNNSIAIDAKISKTSATGTVTFTVDTTSGSANIALNLISLTLTPAQIALAPGTSGSITVRIDGLKSDYNLVLTDQDPDIASAPQSLTVPADSSVTFSINALSLGNCIVTAGNSAVSVFVSDPFTGAGTAGSKPVSVFINDLYQHASVASRPVSVGNLFGNGMIASPLVSVRNAQP